LDLQDGLQVRDGVRDQVNGTATGIADDEAVANLETVWIEAMESIDGSCLGLCNMLVDGREYEAIRWRWYLK
jgi:hypothetical protein